MLVRHLSKLVTYGSLGVKTPQMFHVGKKQLILDRIRYCNFLMSIAAEEVISFTSLISFYFIFLHTSCLIHSSILDTWTTLDQGCTGRQRYDPKTMESATGINGVITSSVSARPPFLTVITEKLVPRWWKIVVKKSLLLTELVITPLIPVALSIVFGSYRWRPVHPWSSVVHVSKMDEWMRQEVCKKMK